MFRLLIDTCVWLDLAKDPHQQILLTTLESLTKDKKVELILPRTVVEEFDRNKTRIVEDATRSISSTLKRAKEIVGKFGEGRRKRIALAEIQDVDHLIPTLGDSAIESVVRIEKLFKSAPMIEITDAVKLRAAQRGIDKKAPFHRPKNGMGDAILIECFADVVAQKGAKGTRLGFITHNKTDFSQNGGDERLPHADIANLFSKIKSLYSISLVELLRRMSPEVLEEATFETEFAFEPRRAGEIIAEIGELLDKIWYNRHHDLRHRMRQRKVKIIPDGEFTIAKSQQTVTRSIWAGAIKAATKMEKKYGSTNLGPWTDFEWGMLNGKLSALRWVVGEDWDSLDT